MATSTDYFVQYRRHRPLANPPGTTTGNQQASQDHMSMWQNNWQSTFDNSNKKVQESVYENNSRQAAEQAWQQLTSASKTSLNGQTQTSGMEMSKVSSSSASYAFSHSTSQTASLSSYSGGLSENGDDVTSLTSSEDGEEANLLGLPITSSPRSYSAKPSHSSSRVTSASSSSSVCSFNKESEVLDYIVHRVVPTDTVQGLCLRYKINSTKLRQANGIVSTSPQDLLARSKLQIPLDSKRKAALGDIPPHVLLSNGAGEDDTSSCVDLLSSSTIGESTEEGLLIDLSVDDNNSNKKKGDSGVLVMSHRNLPGMSMTEAANRWSCVAQDGKTMSAVSGSRRSASSAPSAAETFLSNLSTSTAGASKLLNAVGAGSGTLKRRAKTSAAAVQRRQRPDEYEMIDFTDPVASTPSKGSNFSQFYVGNTTMLGKKQG